MLREDGHKKARNQRASGICMVCWQLCVITPPAKGSGATSWVQKSLKCSSSDTLLHCIKWLSRCPVNLRT